MRILDALRSLWRRPPVASVPVVDVGERALIAAGFDPKQAESLGEQLAASAGGRFLPRRGSAELLAAYATTPWLHATVRRRAEALSSVEWVLYRAAPDVGRGARLRGMRSPADIRHRAVTEHTASKRLVALTDHPLLDLLEEPTAGMPGPLFWELLSKWLDLVGEAPQAMVFDGDDVVEMTPILPTLITQIAEPKRPWFEVQTPRGGLVRVAEEDMLWVRSHDPAAPYAGRGVGTGQVVVDELETDEYMAATAKARFYNQGAPTAFIGILPPPNGTSLTPEQVKQFADEVAAKHRGPNRSGQMHFVSRDIRVQQMQQTLVENQFIDGRRFLRDTCMQVFGVPPEILGVLTSSNRSTIDAADYLFAKFSTLPTLERLRAFYQSQLVPLFGDDLVLDFVSPVPSDKEFTKAVMVALPAAFTLNEVRGLAGQDAIPNGDRPYPAPTGNVPAPGAPKEKPDAAHP